MAKIIVRDKSNHVYKYDWITHSWEFGHSNLVITNKYIGTVLVLNLDEFKSLEAKF